MDKARVLPDGKFGGIFSPENVQPGWVMVDPPTEFFLKAYWDFEGEFWYETATEQDFIDWNMPLVEALRAEYDGYISALCLRHMIRKEMAGVPIPEAVADEYDRLVAECDGKIKELVPSEGYSRSSNQPGKGK